MSLPGASPSRQMLAHRVAELMAHAPFAQMERAHVERFALAAAESYHAPGEVVMQPDEGPVQRLIFVRRGSVQGTRPNAGPSDAGVHYEAGDLFPVSAVVAKRAVTARYEAVEDLFSLQVPASLAQELAALSPVWADFLGRRVMTFLELSRKALLQAQAVAAVDEQAMERPLSSLPRKALVVCSPDEPLIQVLERMHTRRVGSILALGEAGQALGILTRHDVLARVALARPADHTPVLEVMTRPVQVLPESATVQDAALCMSAHGIRHLPIVEAQAHGGAESGAPQRVVNVLSERDLFALQQNSLRRISTQLRQAPDVPALVAGGAAIRRYAQQLVAQGLSARALTQLLSHLNDLLTARLVTLVAQAHGLPLSRCAWLAFGSEGRSEQTIATDQDNGLVFECGPGQEETDRPRWLAFAGEVNQALDACGYPLCKGGVMAGQASLCLSQAEWLARLENWRQRSSPEDVLAATIFFDLRPLVGQAALAAPLRQDIVQHTGQAKLFMRQLAEGLQRWTLPLSWRGALDVPAEGEHRWMDLKAQGTAVFVDAARLFSLAQGIDATGTRERLLAAAPALRVSEREAAGWINGFEVLQMFRLRLQMSCQPGSAAAEHPNRIDVAALDAIDRRVLKEALRMGQALQQRVALDHLR
jgi:CBS domain-containing protein